MNTKSPVDLALWPRRALFEFFNAFEEPFHGVCVQLDVTAAYAFAKSRGISFFLYTVFNALAAAQPLDAFHYSIEAGEVFRCTRVDGGSTVDRPDGTFGFGYYTYFDSLEEFIANASAETARVRASTDLERRPADNRIRFSALPWIDFTALSHARSFSHRDSSPRITFGKMTAHEGRRTMPVSIHVHHAIVDGLHVGQFLTAFQQNLNA